LNAVVDTAGKGKNTFAGILTLQNEIDARIVTIGRKAENGKKLLEYLYRTPMLKINDVIAVLSIGKKAARELIQEFEKLEILEEVTGFKRNRLFVFKRYLALF
jgi:Fic family protein